MTAEPPRSDWTHVCGSHAFPPQFIVQVLKMQNFSQPSHLPPTAQLRLPSVQSQHLLAETSVSPVAGSEPGEVKKEEWRRNAPHWVTPASGSSNVTAPQPLL